MTTVTVPSRCAVAVVCTEHVVAQVYPSSVPIEVFLDDVVELISDDLRRRGVPGLDPTASYELQRANGSRLDVTRTLDELGIGDGATLVLEAATQGEAFEPHYESLSTGLARVGRQLFPPVTERTAVVAAVSILGMMTVSLLGLAGWARAGDGMTLTGLVSVAGGTAIAVGALCVRRWWPGHTDLLIGLSWNAIPLLALGAAAATPGRLGSPHVLIAALAGLFCTAGALAFTGRTVPVGAAVITLCAVAAVLAVIRVWQPVPGQRLAIGTLVGLLFLLTMAPTVALQAARIRPPHFGSVTGRDLFRRRDGMPADAVSPVEGEAEEESDTTPTAASIVASAVRANAVLTGICVAAAITLPVAVWAAMSPGRPYSNAAAILAALMVVIFLSRARAFADRRQAVSLVWGAAAAFCAGVARQVVATGGGAVLWGAVLLLGFGAAALAAALLVPVTRFTPLVRMVVEWLELICAAVALPLAVWICGVFAWIRLR